MKISDYQILIKEWLYKCFDKEICESKPERNHRFLEEALELVQSCDISKEECLRIIDYVYERPKGETFQEVGGVITTLAAFCSSYGIDLENSAKIELDRINSKIEKIREKQKNKPDFKNNGMIGQTNHKPAISMNGPYNGR